MEEVTLNDESVLKYVEGNFWAGVVVGKTYTLRELHKKCIRPGEVRLSKFYEFELVKLNSPNHVQDYVLW